MKKLLLFCTLLTASTLCYNAEAQDQKVGIKTNLLYDATTTFNLGVEVRLGGRTSLDIPMNWNPFTFSDNRKWKHILVQPELRLWTRQTFSGHFFGLHGHYSYYNVGNLPKPFSTNMQEHRYEGWLAGAGVSYGYRWNFSHRWGMEATIGVGYAYMEYGKYDCAKCGDKLYTDTRHYFGPTKVGLSLIYSMGKSSQPIAEPVYVPVIVEREPERKPELRIVEPYMPQYLVSYVTPEAEAVKVRSEAGKAYLDFAVGKSDIVPDFKNNAYELEKIYAMIRSVRDNPDAQITGMTIMGYASPDGGYAANQTLSEKRAQSLKNQIKAIYGFTESMFSVTGVGEDWATLDSLVAQSSLTQKYSILDVIRGSDNLDARERRMMNIAGGAPYRQIKSEMYPQLRRTDYELHYTILPFTVEQGKEVIKVRPSSLSLNEMFLIANTYEPGSDEFNEVFETAARMFPQDDVANLNAAASALSRNDLVQAENYLSRVKTQTADYHNNMGVLYGKRGDWERAAESLGRAAGHDHATRNAEQTRLKLENIEEMRQAEIYNDAILNPESDNPEEPVTGTL